MVKALLKFLLVVVVLAAAAVVILRLVFPLPSLDGRPESTALPASDQTRLGAALLPAIERHDGVSGVIPLLDGRDAFAARAVLARAAEESIDAQYYIWQTDTTGLILLDELRAAAERGVRVRLLVDDNGIPGLDRQLAALNALPTMQVRLFNPFTLRDPKLLSYAFDFPRLNHRMHNKSFTV
ncbi:MAG: phospholipase D family protein, partial [Bauldia sp.]|nr:phospholipase D family protein [Bauldia sp.]